MTYVNRAIFGEIVGAGGFAVLKVLRELKLTDGKKTAASLDGWTQLLVGSNLVGGNGEDIVEFGCVQHLLEMIGKQALVLGGASQ